MARKPAPPEPDKPARAVKTERSKPVTPASAGTGPRKRKAAAITEAPAEPVISEQSSPKRKAKAAEPAPDTPRRRSAKPAAKPKAKSAKAKPKAATPKAVPGQTAQANAERSKSIRDKISDRLKDGTFAPGNRIWEARSSAGPKPIFATPEELWVACVEYFEWVSDNPLTEAKVFPTKEELRVELLPRMRAMTINGLCLFLDIATSTWDEWKAVGGPHFRADLSGIITRVEAVIYESKFSAASVGLLNPNIIARELGLAEKQEHSGNGGGPIEHSVKARVVMVPQKKVAQVQTRPMPEPEA